MFNCGLAALASTACCQSYACRSSLRRVTGRIVAWQDRMGEPRQDHGTQVSLEQYCNNPKFGSWL
jgi:hypothetical protein